MRENTGGREGGVEGKRKEGKHKKGKGRTEKKRSMRHEGRRKLKEGERERR